MDEGAIEPRTALWARAELFWHNQAGALCIARVTLEDTSRSGACVRVDRPIELGSRVTVKWHREQFSAVARNCRCVGTQFLLGLQRETTPPQVDAVETGNGNVRKPVVTANPLPPLPPHMVEQHATFRADPAASLPELKPAAALPIPVVNLAVAPQTLSGQAFGAPAGDEQSKNREREHESHVASRAFSRVLARSEPPVHSFSHAQPKQNHERRAMESKSLFSKFARRPEGSDGAEKPPAKQPASSGSQAANASELLAGPKGDLLSYEDIYRAAGILDARSGYDINKVVEMLHCDRMRGLPDDVRRASVLMAIEAAGASQEALLRQANERERVLDAYESNQRKHLEEYEAGKAQENAQIEAEMARVTGHYAERIKANLDQVAKEKEVLRNWQMAKQSESQRIAEVVDLCTKQASPEPQAAAAAAGARSTAPVNAGPSLVAGGISSRSN